MRKKEIKGERVGKRCLLHGRIKNEAALDGGRILRRQSR